MDRDVLIAAGLGAFVIGIATFILTRSSGQQAVTSSAPTPQQIADQQDQVPPFVPGDYGSGGGPAGLTPSGGS